MRLAVLIAATATTLSLAAPAFADCANRASIIHQWQYHESELNDAQHNYDNMNTIVQAEMSTFGNHSSTWDMINIQRGKLQEWRAKIESEKGLVEQASDLYYSCAA